MGCQSDSWALYRAGGTEGGFSEVSIRVSRTQIVVAENKGVLVVVHVM